MAETTIGFGSRQPGPLPEDALKPDYQLIQMTLTKNNCSNNTAMATIMAIKIIDLY